MALGRTISVKPVPDEMIWLLLAKEFGWSPKQVKEMDAKDVKAITHLLSTYNRVKNQQSSNQGAQSSPTGTVQRIVERETL